MRMFEEQMTQSLLDFVEGKGYIPYVQIPLFVGSIDFVGINDSECIIIESKVNKWRKALKQALRYGYGAEKAYVALPRPTSRNVLKKHREKFVKCGIGLIEVAEVTQVLIDSKHRKPSSLFKQMILDEIEQRERKCRKRIVEFKGRTKIDRTLVSV